MRLEHLLKLLDTSSGVFQRSLRFPDKTNLVDECGVEPRLIVGKILKPLQPCPSCCSFRPYRRPSRMVGLCTTLIIFKHYDVLRYALTRMLVLEIHIY
jgi:hypothetical protein